MAEHFVSPRRLGDAFETRAPPAPGAAAMDSQASKRRGRGSAGGTGVCVATEASGGCGKRGRGVGEGGHSEISASPSDGPPTLPLLPGYAAWYDAWLLAASPGHATSPPGRAPPPYLVPVTGAPRVRRRERARTRAQKKRKMSSCYADRVIFWRMAIGQLVLTSDFVKLYRNRESIMI